MAIANNTAQTTLSMIDGVSPVFRAMGMNAQRFADRQGSALRRANGGMQRMIDTAKGFVLGGVINRGIGMVTSGIQDLTNEWIAFDQASYSAAAKFEDRNNSFISSLEHTKKVSMDVGAQTKFTAAEVAEAMDVMAQGGFTVEQTTTSAMLAISKFATIAGDDIPEASRSLTGAIASWSPSFKVGTTELEKLNFMSNVMVQSFTNSKMSLEDMSESIRISGSIWEQANQDITTYAVSLRALGDINIRNTDAGTRMRSIMLQFYDTKSIAALGTMGIDVTDINNEFRPFFDIMKDIREARVKMTDFDATVFFKSEGVVLKRDVVAFNHLLQLQGNDLNEYMETAGDYANAVRDQFGNMSGSVGHRLDLLKSTITKRFFSGMESARSPLVGFIDDLTDGVNNFDMEKINTFIELNLPKTINTLKDNFKRLQPHLERTGGVLLELGEFFIKYTPQIILFAEAFVAVKIALYGVEVAFGVLAFAQSVGVLAMSAYMLELIPFIFELGLLETVSLVAAHGMGLLSLAMTANPVGIIIVAIGILIIAIVVLIAIIAVVTYHWDEWGESITSWWDSAGSILIFFNPLLFAIVSTVILLNNHWGMLTKSFKEGGLLLFFGNLAKAIHNSLLSPLTATLGVMHSLKLMSDTTYEKAMAGVDKLRLSFIDPVVTPDVITGAGRTPQPLFPTQQPFSSDFGGSFAPDASSFQPDLSAIANQFSGNINITAPDNFGVSTEFSDSVSTSIDGLGGN